MTTLTLTKTVRCIQLGHLYEHIICRQIEMLLDSHDLYPLLDYDVDGKTFYGGIVYVEVKLYSDKAANLADKIPLISVDFTEENISKMAGVILAEKEEPISCASYEAVIEALHQLHAQPWQNLDELSQIDAKTIRRTSYPFFIAEGDPLPARKLEVSVLLDLHLAATHRHLLPLFRNFAWLLMASYQTRLSNTNSYFSFDDKFYDTKQKVGLVNIFKVANANDIYVNIDGDLKLCYEIAQKLFRPTILHAYLKELHSVSYRHRSNLLPNVQYIYEDTLVFIGSKGWREIATMENVKLLLEHMSIEIKFGRKKVSAPLVKD